jgi:importin-7
LNLMCPCLQSYILKAPDQFLAGTANFGEGPIPFMDLIVSIAAKTVTNDRAAESECRFALSLFMSVLHNCPGKIDAYLPLINDVTLGKLGQQINVESSLTRTSIYQVIASALYYNPVLELAELEKRGVTVQVLSKWLQDIDKVDRWLPRKLSILGLASILTIPSTQLPLTVVSAIPQIIERAVLLSLKLKEDVEKGTNKRKESIEDDNPFVEDVSDADQGFGEDQDVTNEVDEAYRKALSGTNDIDDNLSRFLLGDWDNEGDDIDEDYTSPVVLVEELMLLNDTLKMAFQREPEFYQQVQGAVSPETLLACQTLFSTAAAVRNQQVTQQASQQS